MAIRGYDYEIYWWIFCIVWLSDGCNIRVYLNLQNRSTYVNVYWSGFTHLSKLILFELDIESSDLNTYFIKHDLRMCKFHITVLAF